MLNAEEKQLYTFGDLLSMEDGDQYELYDGVLCPVKAASVAHDAIFRELYGQLFIFLQGKKCSLYGSQTPVLLFSDKNAPSEKAKTLVYPDILVVCDPEKLDKKVCRGAPDFIIEILSDSNAQNDVIRKWGLYEKAGVREYWIVYPELKIVNVFLREGNMFSNVTHLYRQTDKIQVQALPGCVIDLNCVFPTF